jgi:amidohydrolase
VRIFHVGSELRVIDVKADGTGRRVRVLPEASLRELKARADLAGSVKFIFQPAEEGAPVGEQGGAGQMIREGALRDPRPDAVFGLHVFPLPLGLAIASNPGLQSLQTQPAQPAKRQRQKCAVG